MKKHIQTFALGVGAGLGITVGGTVYLSLDNKILGAFLFTMGLYIIVLNGLNLFTGKVGYAYGQPFSYIGTLFLVWLGNFAGAFVGAKAILCTRVSQTVVESVKPICETKLGDSIPSIFILAIFCGILMYVAVDGYKKCNNPAILFLCVSVFIFCGFEHCIANMFYFTLGDVWSSRTFLYLLIMTAGNSVGGNLIPIIRSIGSEV